MINDIKHWDSVHQRLHDEKSDEGHSKYAEDKEAEFPRNCLVVDMGGGSGADAIYFLKKGHSVIVLDISGFALKVAEKRAVDAGFADKLITRQVDFGLHKLPLKDDSVDVVYSRISLNYFPEDQTTALFKDIYRVLKPGANAYLTFKSPQDSEEMKYLQDNAVIYEEGVYIQAGQLRSRFSQDQLSKMLKNAGILNSKVTPITEDLAGHKEGHTQELHVNEVSFGKN